MPLITKLSARNMQGQTFTDELYPVTLICGDNARGKTTRINTLCLTLAGYAPGISQKGHDIFEAFATGNPLVTEGWFENGNHVGNSWTERSGSVKAEKLGNGEYRMPPVLLDADEYFGLSGPERTRFIFAIAKLPEELSITKLTNTLSANVKNITLEENTEQSQMAIAEVAETIVDAGSKSGSQTPQDWIADLAEDLRKRKNLADQNVKRLEKTVQGLAQVRETAAQAPQDAEVRLTEARTALDAANGDVARLLEAGKTLKRQLDEVEASGR